MSRLRTIKPGFFLDECLADCPPLARLLFAGLWTIADREGRLEDRPRRIKAEVLPYDDCDVETLLASLAARGFIVRYEHEGGQYIAIPTWHKHQSPHIKEAESTIPAPCKNGAGTVLSAQVLSLGSCLGSGDLEPGMEVTLSLAEPDFSADFEAWWTGYGKVGSKADALKCYVYWRNEGATADELALAAQRYRHWCAASDTSIKHAPTFLAKHTNRWREWIDEEHGLPPAHRDKRALDGQKVAAAASWFMEGDGDDSGRSGDGRERHPRGLPSGNV